MYTQEITRQHRAAIVIAIDQSCSMGGRMMLNGWNLSKAEVVSMVTGRLIDELILRSHRDGEYRHYYDIALLGYSGEEVYSLLGGDVGFYPITTLAGREVRRTRYTLNYKTMLCGRQPFEEQVSLWVEPRAQGATPMYRMVATVTKLVKDWCEKEANRESFPPIVINITDGEASDASCEVLRIAANNLKNTGTQDGNTIFANIHISSDTSHTPILFPNIYEVPLEIRHAHLIMDMSSVMPEPFHPYIRESRSSFSQPPYNPMGYNASKSELVAMLNIGTRSLKVGM